MLTMGSLFDGIGGFPLAGIHNGIVPVWASEIETFPMEVTKIRFPGMIHAGDITKLDGAKLPPVHVVCGGSPCQDLSVAGQRRGLAGERSGLFMDQVRIVKEMREAEKRRGVPDHLIRPRYLVWENVPGAFSSAGGEDFRAVIEEIVRIKDGSCHVPRPDAGRWEPAGAAILGDEFSLAWRVLDAQFWGVPQRRRRIFLVADFGGRTAYQILFEQYRLPGDPAEGKSQGEGAAAATGGSPEDPGGDWIGEGQRIPEKRKGIPDGCLCLNDQGGERMDVSEDMTATLRAGMSGHPPLVLPQGGETEPVVFDNHGQDARFRGPVSAAQTVSAGFGMGGNNQPLVLADQQGGLETEEDIRPTITGAAGNSGKGQPVLFENHGIDARYTGPHGVAPTMSARYGTGGNNVPLVSDVPESYCIAGNIIDREAQNGGNGLGCQPDISYTLTGMDRHAVFRRQSGGSQPESYCIVGNIIDRKVENGANGLGCQPDISYTLTSTDRHAVFSRQRTDELVENDVVATQSARQHKDATDLVLEVAGLDCRNGGENGDICGTLQPGTSGNSLNSIHPVRAGNLIRRLTPLECERLQGFPDGWTLIPGASDSARYKALGNSVAIPCVDFVLRGIAYFLKK